MYNIWLKFVKLIRIELKIYKDDKKMMRIDDDDNNKCWINFEFLVNVSYCF